MEERYIAAVDMGSSKISIAIGLAEGDNIQIVYYDSLPSDGITTGAVFNPQKAGSRLGELISKAEDELKIKIHQIVTSYPKCGVRQQLADGEMPRTDPSSSITEEELLSLKNISMDSFPLADREKETIYGAVVQSFATEDYFNAREQDVIGMISDRLSGNFKVFVGSKRRSDNIDAACNVADIAIYDKYFSPEIEGKVVLTAAEMENGVALIDMGGGATTVSIFHNGALRYSGTVPFGGKTITGDIRRICAISEPLAENIKMAFGCCIPDRLQTLSEKILQINFEEDVPSKQLSVRNLAEIIAARQREIFDAVLWHIQKSGLSDDLRSGIVLTGGASEMNCCEILLKEMSGYTVRRGSPRRFFSQICERALSPEAIGCAGMVLEARKASCLNCAEVPEIVEEEVTIEENDEPQDGFIFSQKEMGEVEKKKKKTKIFKVRKDDDQKEKKNSGPDIGWNLFSSVENALNSYYDRTEDKDNG